jgi:hypothetical protein
MTEIPKQVKPIWPVLEFSWADFANAVLVTIISQLPVPVIPHITVQEGGQGGGHARGENSAAGGWRGGGVTLGGDSAAGGAGKNADFTKHRLR